MPIKNLPTSFRKLGKIRLGESVPVMENGAQAKNRDGTLKFRPAKIEDFRLTSPRRELLEGAAEAYGGEVKPWDGAPGEDDEWQVFTSSKVLDITIPPVFIDEDGDVAGATFSQWNEMWSKGGCARRCDGVDETLSGQKCSAMKPMCPVDHEERSALASLGKACKMTTRLMVILPRVPDLGVWMLESHGWYAAVELGGFMEFLARRAPGQFVDAKLRLEARTVKRGGKTRNFAVPVIELPQATAGELLAAPSTGRELGTGNGIVTDAERVRSFVIKVSDAGWDDDVRHAIVSYATKGRTSSSREVAPDEWPAVEAVLRWLNEEKLVVRFTNEGGAYLHKAMSGAAEPAAPSAPGGPIPVQSREAGPADEPEFDVDGSGDDSAPPVENPADDWDRTELMTRLDNLDDEHRETAKARWMEQGIVPPNGVSLTKDHVAAAAVLLDTVEREAITAYKNRLTMAKGAMKAVGVTTAEARNQLVSSATDGRVESPDRLSAADAQAVADYCQRIADEEAAEAASEATAAKAS